MYKKIKSVLLLGIVSLIISGCNHNQNSGEIQNIVTGYNISISEHQITESVMFVPIVIDDVPMEIMFVRASDGAIRVALNTCENCHATCNGYYVQEGDVVICQQCNMSFDIDYIGLQSGGCQPIPIEHSFENYYVHITYEALLENVRWFVHFNN
jgi:nitrite reductase/ring-hydroxylating ferredoxin subunit